MTHYLESWGDATTNDGTVVPVQPLIQPLFGGLTELEFLARLAGESQTSA
jgi:molybdopterin-containing oxidoreductase family iron-sulfur binding subunit